MKLTFIGADHEVTGSCHFLEAAGKKILVDYGMEQGRNTFENAALPVSAAEIDYVFITHAHIDHTGLLPLLSAQGFSGRIYATRATCDLCDIMLLDSAGIQEFEAEWRNRKGKRRGEALYVPLYSTEDAVRVLRSFVECDYDRIIEVSDGIRIRFTDVGHLLGSAAIEVWLSEGGVEKKLVFSGDIGNSDQPLLRDPQRITEADYVVMESTYGTRSHGSRPDYVASLAEVLQRTFDRGGNVVIPSFAVGRTQEILYFLRQIKKENRVKNYPGFEVYVDSPLAVRATNIFNTHTADCFDEEAAALVRAGQNPIAVPNLRLSLTSEESKAINDDPNPKVILSASGMCEAGRIRHHLKHNLWRKECTILFVGYQSDGTLGRLLLNGAKKAKLFGEEITVNARILSLPGISGHADNAGLMKWIGAFKEKPARVFVIHGESSVTELFAGRLRNELGLDADAPYSGAVFDLKTGGWIYVAEPVPIEKAPTQVAGAPAGTDGTVKDTAAADLNRSTPAYEALVAQGNALMEVIRVNKGGANADLRKFTEQIRKLAAKWTR